VSVIENAENGRMTRRWTKPPTGGTLWIQPSGPRCARPWPSFSPLWQPSGAGAGWRAASAQAGARLSACFV